MTESASDLQAPRSAVLHEAAHLLQGLRLAPRRAAFVQGEYVTVFIAPSWEEQTFHLCFTCRPCAHQTVDWSRLVLWACSLAEALHPPTHRIGLNKRGQRCLTVEAVGYVLRALYLDEATRLTAPARRTASGQGLLRAAAAESSEAMLAELRVSRSPDSKLAAKAIARDSHLEIVFETHAPELAGAIVYLWRQTEEAGGPVPVADLTLQTKEAKLWRATWTGPVLSREQDFAFTLRLPQDRGRGES